LARYLGPACKICRRENLKLFLKGDRCFKDKCGIERRAYPPGQHGQGRRGKVSDYGVQLREKQKVRKTYGILEKQFRGYYKRAVKMKGVTGENLLVLLERRLDNVVYRGGFAASRNEARQMISHNHFTINGHKANIPSMLVKPGDLIEVKEKSVKLARFQEMAEAMDRKSIPAWIDVDKGGMKAKMLSMPTREDITLPINENLIVELYSK